MDFTNARSVEQICWQMRLADYPRGLDRARIDSLANGAPPYPEAEAQENRIEVNVNDLTMTRLTQEARLQLYQAFNKPDAFFRVSTDCGASTKRNERAMRMTKLINRPLKRSLPYYEAKRSKFAGLVLHGRGPSHWSSLDRWRPVPIEISDILVPSRTLLTFDNLPFFAVYRSYTVPELKRLTRYVKPGNNPGWDMKVLNQAMKWADEQTAKLYGGTQWAEYWAPTKQEARFKEDAGVYASDLAQTIDCWDFYYWDDAGKHEGWRRRMIFDAFGGYSGWMGPKGYGARKEMPTKNLLKKEGQFLFTSGNRVVADNISDILHFQFADLSAQQPFTYHGVRSLGFLLYAVCHLQNRLRCSFTEAVFFDLMRLMRVRNADDVERALSIQLANNGFIPESLQFLRPDERWKPDYQLSMLGLNEFKQIIQDNSSAFTQNQNYSRDRVEKTKFQVMAEVNAMQSMVSSALGQAYRYEQSEYETIVKRFMRPHSTDPDVIEFRARAIQEGIPEKYLTPDAWDVQPERIWGGGNKTMELQVASQLMEWRAAYSPAAQEMIKRKAYMALTENADEALVAVPTEQQVSSSRHAAMSAVGTIMSGGRQLWLPSQNLFETCETLITELMTMISDVKQFGGMASEDRILGFQNMLAHIGILLAQLGQDPAIEKDVSRMSEMASEAKNEVKGMEQRLQEQKQAQGQNGNGEMEKLMMSLYTDKVKAETKAKITEDSHIQRTAQRQSQDDLQRQRREEDHQQELRHRTEDHAVDTALKIAEAEANPRGAGPHSASQQGGVAGD